MADEVEQEETLVMDEAEVEVAPKPKRAAKPKGEVEPIGMGKRIKIILEPSEDIPPTGLPISHNGRPFVIVPGEPVEVPDYLLDILDNAIVSGPIIDPQTRRVIGTRDRLRFPYRKV